MITTAEALAHFFERAIDKTGDMIADHQAPDDGGAAVLLVSVDNGKRFLVTFAQLADDRPEAP